mmetsp:Transcript_2878/g.8713  ORF Transcript_2878/g.8713 Transcript_2878/m.8713 type:complete len:225 (-) Transcript_2878:112-786(-)
MFPALSPLPLTLPSPTCSSLSTLASTRSQSPAANSLSLASSAASNWKGTIPIPLARASPGAAIWATSSLARSSSSVSGASSRFRFTLPRIRSRSRSSTSVACTLPAKLEKPSVRLTSSWPEAYSIRARTLLLSGTKAISTQAILSASGFRQKRTKHGPDPRRAPSLSSSRSACAEPRTGPWSTSLMCTSSSSALSQRSGASLWSAATKAARSSSSTTRLARAIE